MRARGELPSKAGRNTIDQGSARVLPGRVGVTLVVNGRPAPQGSKNPGSMTEANWRTDPWRQAIVGVLADLPDDWKPLDGPLAVAMTFYFEPPKSASPGDLPKTKHTYDLDKLVRAVDDALTAGKAIADDARVVDLVAKKRYVWPGEGEPRVVVSVLSQES